MLYKYHINKIENVDVNFTIDLEVASEETDDRYFDQLGQFAKLYYYMFPHMWYESFQMKSIINQSFFLAYEFRYNYKIRMWPIFFRFPKNSDGFTINNNFVPNNYILNPQVETDLDLDFFYSYQVDNFFEELNWFSLMDYDFRNKINIYDEDFKINFNLSHLKV